ncbi:hypothetical protein COC42_08220 [Sphingomonas spermidinifaciens]|uniref:Uncharacterized protein n=1 Tax=Sphingomonas spermidinifaciens TaxID=1141889 RepID=A0A2A4B858_9SPHN|nr:hypothetical protein [Sphingomonas spermidinifaciens]PCD04260.1 hypothetical protein COC42_08220 [Sphingomonas spermidinifaciens]
MLRTLAAAAMALAATPAIAQSYYAAVPATAPAKASIVTRTTVWKCEGGTCAAPRAGSRDAIMCELLVREVGPLQRFAAAGADFDTAALDKCNARAKD